MQCPQHAVILTVTHHLHRHLHAARIQDRLDPLPEVPTLLRVVAELIQVVQVDPLHEVRTITVVREHPHLGELVALGDRLVQADEVEPVDRDVVLSWLVLEDVALLVVETQG